MKKIFCMLLLLIMTLCPIFVGCNNANTVTQNGVIYEKTTFRSGDTSTDGYVIAGCKSNVKILNIASEIKGLPVLGFKRTAFEGNTNLKEVTLPNTITEISLNEAPFKGCTNIEKLTLATCDVENLFKVYGSGDENNTEPLPESLKQIYLTSACTEINSRSFRYCTYLQELYIPSSVANIYDGTGGISIGVNGNSHSGSKFNNLPFLGCSNLTIYCEVESAPNGWGKYWNYIDSETQANVIWNHSSN